MADSQTKHVSFEQIFIDIQSENLDKLSKERLQSQANIQALCTWKVIFLNHTQAVFPDLQLSFLLTTYRWKHIVDVQWAKVECVAM